VVADGEVHRDRVGQVHQPQAGHDVEEPERPLAQLEAQGAEELAEVDSEQAEEEQADRPVGVRLSWQAD
jgi:hypothetical protein